MANKLLEFNIPDVLPDDYDPILGRSVGDIKSVTLSKAIETNNELRSRSSVFDDPDLDFSYTPNAVISDNDSAKLSEVIIDNNIANNEKPPRPNLTESEVAELLGVTPEELNQPKTEPTESETSTEILPEALSELRGISESDAATIDETITDLTDPQINQDELAAPDIAPEIQPFETFDGAANEALNQADEEGNITDALTFADEEEAVKEVHVHNEQSAEDDVVDVIADDAKVDTEVDIEVDIEANIIESSENDLFAKTQIDETTLSNEFNSPDEETPKLSDKWNIIEDEIITGDTNEIAIEEAPRDAVAVAKEVPNELDAKELSPNTSEETSQNIELVSENSNDELTTSDQVYSYEVVNDEIRDNSNNNNSENDELFDDKADDEQKIDALAIIPEPENKSTKQGSAPNKKRRKKKQKHKINDFALIGGIFFSGMSALLLLTSLLSPLGAPFDAISSYGLYWMGFAFVGAIIWLSVKEWLMTIVSLVIIVIYGYNILPWLGASPIGGQGNAKTIGWANVEKSGDALQNFIAQADKNDANLLIVAGANGLIAGDIKHWRVIQVPIANDPSSLAVLAKDEWRAVTLIGEPTMVQPSDNKLTIIGVGPTNAPAKDNALINRAANRTGDMETPVLTIGDFGAVAWDRTLKDFAKTSISNRVRCGGYFVITHKTGILGVSSDHAFVHNANVKSCTIGNSLSKSSHKPIFISILNK